ncbi:MAG: hypothetical protein ACPK7O_00590 [Methanobacterium sp.]
MDQKGYVISGISFLLIIPAIYFLTLFVDMTHSGSESQASLIQSDVVFSTARDIEGNLPIIAEKTFQKTGNEVLITGDPLINSRSTIKDNLQWELDNSARKYSKEGINVTCKIIAVDSSPDPFKVQINSSISVSKGNIAHNENISQDISIINPNYPIPDPLPFIKCKNFGNITNTSSRVVYGTSLANFLKSSDRPNSDIYINATSPLIFKKCPYDPYISHGESQNKINFKNCIDNGYYHESSDGACFLCRLEGKGVCSHYGMETFIIPAVSTNNTSFEAPCSSDHVIFGGNYSGYTLIYFSDSNGYYKIFLENGHRSKYGVI